MMRAQYKGLLGTVLYKILYPQHTLLLIIRGRNKARQGSIKPVPCRVTDICRGQFLRMCTQSSLDLQQRKTRIGQLNLCRMKLPYRQRQQERASRVRRDHKLALPHGIRSVSWSRLALSAPRQRSSRRR